MHMGRTRMDEIADLATRLRDSGSIEIPNAEVVGIRFLPLSNRSKRQYIFSVWGAVCAIASEKRNSQANGSSEGTKFAGDIYRTTCQMHLGGMK
jgi:hypothetical protein